MRTTSSKMFLIEILSLGLFGIPLLVADLPVSNFSFASAQNNGSNIQKRSGVSQKETNSNSNKIPEVPDKENNAKLSRELIGTWELTRVSGKSLTYTFFEDGKLTINDSISGYTADVLVS